MNQNTFTGHSQELSISNANNERINGLPSRKPRGVTKVLFYTTSDSEDEDDHENSAGDIEQQRQHAHSILDYSRNTLEIQPDGTIIIKPHYRHLPFELITLIVGHVTEQQDLCQCTRVNKDFYAVASPRLWKAPKIDNNLMKERLLSCLFNNMSFTTTAAAQDLHHTPTLGHYIRTLTLSGNYWMDADLLLLLPYIRNLQHFFITSNMPSITKLSTSRLPRYCPDLVTFDVDHHINVDTLQALGQHCHASLKYIAFRSCPRITFDLFRYIAPCRRIEQFILHFIDGIYGPMTVRMAQVIAQWKSLRHLEISQLRGLAINRLFTVAAAAALNSTPWPLLTDLDLDECDELGDDILIPFLQSHPCISHLSLPTGRFTDSALDTMATCLPDLTTLHLCNNDDITAIGVQRLVSNGLQLKKLSLEDCAKISLSDFPGFHPPNGIPSNCTGRTFDILLKRLDRLRYPPDEDDDNNDADRDNGVDSDATGGGDAADGNVDVTDADDNGNGDVNGGGDDFQSESGSRGGNGPDGYSELHVDVIIFIDGG
ncbi:unnamed protein product [Absidia cylindrospora]